MKKKPQSLGDSDLNTSSCYVCLGTSLHLSELEFSHLYNKEVIFEENTSDSDKA